MKSKLAIWALIIPLLNNLLFNLGFNALPFATPIYVTITIIGFVIAIKALKEMKLKQLEGKWMAILGLVISSLTLIFLILFWIVYYIFSDGILRW